MYRHRYYIVAYAIQLKYDKPAKSDLYDVFFNIGPTTFGNTETSTFVEEETTHSRM